MNALSKNLKPMSNGELPIVHPRRLGSRVVDTPKPHIRGKTLAQEQVKLGMSLPNKTVLELEDMLVDYTDRSITWSEAKASLVRIEMLRRGMTPEL